MKEINYIFIITLLAVGLSSCSKWTDPSPLQVQDLNLDPYSNSVYKEYIEHIKNFKNTEHPLTLGFLGEWDPQIFSRKLTTLPDSLDMVVIMNPPKSLEGEALEEMKDVQANKGTKVLYYLNVLEMSDSLMEVPDLSPEQEESAIKDYVNDVIKEVKDGAYDGLVVNLEGNICYSCSTLFSKEGRIDFLFSLLSSEIGPGSSTEKMLIVQGEPKDIGDENGSKIDYIITNTNGSSHYYEVEAAFELFEDFPSFSPEKFIVTTNFSDPDIAKTGGPIFYVSPEGDSKPSSLALAQWNPLGYKKGGVAVYNIENDFGNDFFSYTRSVISIQNPPIK